MENDLVKIRAKINGEDRPDDIWFIETMEEMCQEIEELRNDKQSLIEEMAGVDI